MTSGPPGVVGSGESDVTSDVAFLATNEIQVKGNSLRFLESM